MRDIAEHKPRPHTSTYVYAGSLSVLGLAIGGTSCVANLRNQNEN